MSVKPERPPVPECDKLSDCVDAVCRLGHFLDWLTTANKEAKHPDPRASNKDKADGKPMYEICRWYVYNGTEYRGRLGVSYQNLIYAYFGIDPVKLEEERVALLDWSREMNEYKEKPDA